MSTLPVIKGAMRKLTAHEMRQEMAWILGVLENAKRLAGMEHVTFRVEWNGRFTRRLGDSLVIDRLNSVGRLRFSSSALYLRATVEERTQLVYHEAAHSLADILHQKRCKHGPLWKRMMRTLGRTPDRCHTVDRSGLHRKGSRAERWGRIMIEAGKVGAVARPAPRVQLREVIPAPVVTVAHEIEEDILVSWTNEHGKAVGRVLEISADGIARIFVVGDHQRAKLGRFAKVAAADCSRY